MTIIEILIAIALLLIIFGLVVFYTVIYQVIKYTDNLDMYDGGDIIGIGDNDDMINPATTTKTTIDPPDDTYEYPPTLTTYTIDGFYDNIAKRNKNRKINK